jgi:hypothetical protein
MVKAKKNFGDDVIDSLPAGAISQSGAYVPPHLRKATGMYYYVSFVLTI